MPIEHLDEPSARIYEIAEASFKLDVRFFDALPPSETEMRRLIREYVDGMHGVYVCRYKDEVIGYCEVVDAADGEAFVRFAAVDEKFRRTGAAMSMYAGVFKTYRELGYKKILGKISSRNMSALNVWRELGAIFSNPEDVYLRVRNSCTQ